MDNDEKNKRTDEDKTTSEEVRASNDQSQRAHTNDDAGPSGTINLPGAVHHVKSNIPAKPGISKSEHNIRHIITSKDVTNALKSLSFGTPAAQIIKNLNLKELKIPILDRDETIEKVDSTTLIDLKKFMASCFKFNKETSNAIVLGEIPNVQNVAVMSPVAEQEIANSSFGNIQTESVPLQNANEVIITNSIEPKLSKADKKKTSGSLSERSDLGVAQRDSLSSIGSNVCRICMTRGRERLVLTGISNLVPKCLFTRKKYSFWCYIRCFSLANMLWD